jgi:hypothetical protein
MNGEPKRLLRALALEELAQQRRALSFEDAATRHDSVVETRLFQ